MFHLLAIRLFTLLNMAGRNFQKSKFDCFQKMLRQEIFKNQSVRKMVKEYTVLSTSFPNWQKISRLEIQSFLREPHFQLITVTLASQQLLKVLAHFLHLKVVTQPNQNMCFFGFRQLFLSENDSRNKLFCVKTLFYLCTV